MRNIVSVLHHHYKRVTGERGNDLGDLTWLTLESFDAQSKLPDVRPVRGEPHPNAVGKMREPLSLSSQRRLAENLRQALVSASIYVRANLPDGDEKDSLLQAYDKEYQAFGDFADEAKRELFRQQLLRERSPRQDANWIDWDKLLQDARPLFQEFLDTLDDPTVAISPTKWKRIQTILLLALHVGIPPFRNDFAGLRFVYGQADPDSLRDSKSPNYIQVEPDGTMTLVMNAYKTDKKALSAQYDIAQGDFILDHERTLRRKLVPDAILSKYGFQPNLVAEMLRRYSTASDRAFDQTRNPHAYVFYNFGAPGTVVTSIQEDALSKRLGRLLKATIGRSPRSQLFRPMFVTWLGHQRPSMAEREYFSDWMAHSVEMQLSTYDKRLAAGEVQPGAKRARTLLRDEGSTGGGRSNPTNGSKSPRRAVSPNTERPMWEYSPRGDRAVSPNTERRMWEHVRDVENEAFVTDYENPHVRYYR